MRWQRDVRPDGQMVGGAARVGRLHHAAAMHRRSTRHGDTVQPGDGPRGVEAAARRVDVEPGVQRLEPAGVRPLVEIARQNDRFAIPAQPIGQMGQLGAAMTAEEA